MANQNFNTFGRGGVIADQATFDAGLRAHMIRVYNYMASGLALSGIVAFALFSSSDLAGLFFQVAPGNRVVGLNVLGWVAIFAPLGLLLLTSFRAAQMSVGAVQAVYWAVTALMGVSLSLLLFHYTGASVARTFFVTAAALVRPSKSVLDLEAASVMKRMKDKAFARGVKREDLRAGAELLGLPLEEHIGNVIAFMRERADALGLRGAL